MLNTNKYYTPSIEEFYTGFEYYFCSAYQEGISATEVTIDGVEGFEPIIFDYNFIYNYIRNGDESWLDFMQSLLGHNQIKVKYLDIEDIESLGFENSLDESGEWFWSFKGNGDIQLYYDDKITDDIKGVGISIYNGDLVFNGYIKNKSELVKLLKQLNIC